MSEVTQVKRSAVQDISHLMWLVLQGVILGYNLAVQHGWVRVAITAFLLVVISVTVVFTRRYFGR